MDHMTAVAERTTSSFPLQPRALPGRAVSFTGEFSDQLPAGPEASASHETAHGAPLHCGTRMTPSLAPSPSVPWAQTHTDMGEWVCACGFRQDSFGLELAVDPLAAVHAAGARLETLQWEMDAAEAAFASAVKSAMAAGAESTAIAAEAGLTHAELLELLQ